MRYTTIIDLTHLTRLWRNTNAIRLYYYLSCVAGYHDNDRDVVDRSLRTMAREAHMTLSAVRYAMATLTKYNLVVKTGPIYIVRHWLKEQPITPREDLDKKSYRAKMAEQEDQARQIRQEQQARQDQIRLERAKSGKTSFMLYYESLQEKAAAGDLEAADMVEKHRAMYIQHQEEIRRQNEKSKTNEPPAR